MIEEEVVEKKGYKKTKFGWIPKDWKVSSFKEIATFFSGGTPKTSVEEFYIGNIPFIKSGEIKSLKTNQNISELALKSCSAKMVTKGDLLMALYGANSGDVSISKIKGAINQAILCIRSNEDLVYLYNFLLENKKDIIRKYLQGGQGNLSAQIIKKIEIPIPELKEQKAIANCLGTWDIAIEKQTQLIEAKQTQKKALVQQLLTGKKRLPGFSDEWEEKSLYYYLDYKPRPINKPSTPFTKLGIRSHCKGTFQNRDFKPEAIAIDKLFEVKKNDLIVNITFAWEGAIAIVKEEDKESLVSHRFPTYIFKERISSSLFFEQFIKTKKFRFLLNLISPGGAGRNRVMSKKDFLKLKITIPEYKEQTAIANILNTADKEIKLLQTQLTQLQQQKKGLMQQLLTGKKRLKH